MSAMRTFGAMEAGGTKFVCAVGEGPGRLQARTQFPTTAPEETIGRAIAFFRAQGPLLALGIASFGPIDLRPSSATFGYITTTPKTGWRNVDIAGEVGRALGVPIGFDTDVNAAALGEGRWGAAEDMDTFVYLTVGTGIGGGGIANGRLLHGLLHPEMGHIRVPHDWSMDAYPGACPYHGDCLEGLASGTALEARWGVRAEKLPDGHEAWDLEAHYLALGLVSWICTLSPQRVIMGGGVMERAELFGLLRRKVQELLGGYVQAPEITERIAEYIVSPALGRDVGVLGALALAQDVMGRR